MNMTLQNELARRWPAISRGQATPVTESSLSHEFNCGDGWYPIINEVIRTLTDDCQSRGLQGAAAAERTAALRYPLQHRAGPDARRWAEVMRILKGLA